MVRPFRTPAVGFVSLMGVLICAGMIIALDIQTLTVAAVWMIVGLVIYFLYSRHHSKLKNYADILPTADDFEKR